MNLSIIGMKIETQSKKGQRGNTMIEAKIIKGDTLIFQSVANTKQEAELDLLYQLMQYFDFSIHINPDYNPTNSPTNNPTKEQN